MPSLIVQRHRKPKRKTPPCGRLIHYVEPTSPFQKLLDQRRRELKITGRGLARELSTIMGKPVAQSTIWIWLHSENGFPHPKAFKPAHATAICKVLKIPKVELQQALDASRHLYTPKENPMPVETMDAFGAYIQILENDPRGTMKKSYVLNLARSLYNGARNGAAVAK